MTQNGRFFLIVLYWVLLSSLAFSLQTNAAYDGYDYYEDGAQAYENGEYSRAVVQLKNALQQDPKDLPSRILLGWANLRVGNAAGAAKELQLARRLGADEEFILIPLGNAYLLQRKHQQILDEIRSSNPADPGSSEVLVIRGQAYLQLKQLAQAEREFKRARDLNPLYVEPILGLVRVELARFNVEAAQVYVAEAQALAPQSAETWFLAGELARVQKGPAQAINLYNRALEINPAHMRARNSRAAVRLEKGQSARAIEDLDYILEHAPQDAQAAYLKAMAASKAGDAVGARAAMEKASENLMQLSPERMQREPASLLLAGMVAQSQGSLDQARIYLRNYIQLRPRHVGSRKLLGRVLLDLKLSNQALEVLYPALKNAPEDAELLALIGSALLMQQDFREAGAMFERAIALLPENAQIQTQLAVGQVGTGDSDLALESLEDIVETEPRQSRAGVLLAMMYARSGRGEDALRTAELLLRRWPDEPTYLNLRGSLNMSAGHLDKARSDFEKAEKVSPGYLPARLNLGKIDVMQGKFDAAEERYLQILDDRPREAIALRSLARVAIAKGDTTRAIAWVEEARAADPDATEISFDLVALYLQAEEYQAARDLALSLVADYPESPEAVEILARVEIALGELGRAKDVLRKVARFPSFDVDKLMSIAQLQLSIKDYAGSRITLSKALKQYPEATIAAAGLVRLDMLLGNFDKALADARAVARRYPDDPEGAALVGEVLQRKGLPLLAVGAYQAALQQEPDPVIAIRQFYAWREGGAIEAGIWYLENWLRERPGDAGVYRVLGAAYLSGGNIAQALAVHEVLLELYPLDPSVLNNLAWIYNETGDERALDFARRAYDLSPDDPVVLDTLGWVLVSAGEPREGIGYLRQAQSRVARDPQIRYHLAYALAELDRGLEARRILEPLLASPIVFQERADATELLRALLHEERVD